MTFYRPGASLAKLVVQHPKAAAEYLINQLKEKYVLIFLKERKIRKLTGATSLEIKTYLDALRSNVLLERHFREAINNYGFPIAGMTTPLRGPILYVLCRAVKPLYVVETGVASGVSSTFILQALEDNHKGELFSIDLPDPNVKTETGWIIPEQLRSRWHLTVGKTQDKLVPILEDLKIIDMFLHDSEHSYENMIWEYRNSWLYLSPGGLLLSDDINSNNAFSDFSKEVKRIPVRFNLLGGIRK